MDFTLCKINYYYYPSIATSHPRIAKSSDRRSPTSRSEGIMDFAHAQRDIVFQQTEVANRGLGDSVIRQFCDSRMRCRDPRMRSAMPGYDVKHRSSHRSIAS